MRTEHGLTQQELSETLGSGRVTVARYETGERTPDAEFLLALKQKLGVCPMWILTGEGHQPEPAERMSPREFALLDNYRHSDEKGRAVVEAAALAAAKPKKGKKAG